MDACGADPANPFIVPGIGSFIPAFASQFQLYSNPFALVWGDKVTSS
jgi:hypothetical protein